MNKTTRIIRSEEITIDAHIFTVLAGGRNPGEIYFAAIMPSARITPKYRLAIWSFSKPRMRMLSMPRLRSIRHLF